MSEARRRIAKLFREAVAADAKAAWNLDTAALSRARAKRRKRLPLTEAEAEALSIWTARTG